MVNALISTLIFLVACIIFYTIVTHGWTRDASKQIDDKMPVIVGNKQYFVFNAVQMAALKELVNNHALIVHQNKVLLAIVKETTKEQKGR